MRSRTRWRSRRFTRLRVTAGPTASRDHEADPGSWSPCVEPGQVRPPASGRRHDGHDGPPRGIAAASVRRLPGKHTEPSESAGSGGEAVAALAPARGQDGAPGTGAHPQAEAVRLVTTPVVRLERTLAHEVSAHGRGRLKGCRPVAADRRRAQPEVKQPIDAGPTCTTVRGARGEGQTRSATTCAAGDPTQPTRPHAGRTRSTSDTPTGLETCGQPVDPPVSRLLVSGHESSLACRTPGPDPLKPHVPDNRSTVAPGTGTGAQPVDKRVDMSSPGRRNDERGRARVEQPSSATDLAQLWTTIVEGTAPAQRVWLATSKPVMHAENTFVIAVPNEFTMNQYASKLRTWVEDTLTEHLGHPTRLVVTIDPKLDTGRARHRPRSRRAPWTAPTPRAARPNDRTNPLRSAPRSHRPGPHPANTPGHLATCRQSDRSRSGSGRSPPASTRRSTPATPSRPS